MSLQIRFQWGVSKAALLDALRFTAPLPRKSAARLEQRVRLTSSNGFLTCEGLNVAAGMRLSIAIPMSERVSSGAVVLEAHPLMTVLEKTDESAVILKGSVDQTRVEVWGYDRVLASLPWFQPNDFPNAFVNNAPGLQASIHADSLNKLGQKIRPWCKQGLQTILIEFDGSRAEGYRHNRSCHGNFLCGVQGYRTHLNHHFTQVRGCMEMVARLGSVRTPKECYWSPSTPGVRQIPANLCQSTGIVS